MGERRGVHRVLVRNLRKRDHWGDPDVDGRIILSWIFRNLEGVVGTGWSWLRIWTGGGNVLPSCRTIYLLKKDSAPWSK
jgi:hypothetical protein